MRNLENQIWRRALLPSSVAILTTVSRSVKISSIACAICNAVLRLSSFTLGVEPVGPDAGIGLVGHAQWSASEHAFGDLISRISQVSLGGV